MLPLLLLLSLLPAAELIASEFVCAGHSFSVAPGAGRAKSAYSRPELLSKNRVNALVVFARFADEDSDNHLAPSYASNLFSPDLPGSMAHFYHAMSSGQFTIRGTALLRRYGSPHPASHYLADNPGEKGKYGQFARQLLPQIDQDVDFRLFDNDGPDGVPDSGDDDGWVDYLFIDLLSAPRGFILDGATGVAGLGFSDPYYSKDVGASGELIRVGGGIPQGAFCEEGTFAQTVGTMAHEFGHSLGLRDLYDLVYDSPATDSAGIGKWGLMGWGAHGWNGDDGPNPFCAWSLKQLGWIGGDDDRLVELLDDATELAVQPLHSGGSAYSIPLRMPSNEYLLLERRTRAGTYYDRHLPGEGLLIWHVHPGVSTNEGEQSKLIDLMCADGLYRDAGFPRGRRADGENGSDNLDFWSHDQTYTTHYAGNQGDATDPFDGIRYTRFDLSSNPSSDPQNLLPQASTGLVIEMHQHEGDMRLSVTQPRWGGTIRSDVHWRGHVLVDGDITVAPEGRLTIYPGSRVRFAAADRLRGGRDPERCELHVQGELLVRGASYVRPWTRVVFEPWHPGGTWHGILFDLAAWFNNPLSSNTNELIGADRGVMVLPPEHPALLILDETHTDSEIEKLHRTCDEALANLGMKAAVVTLNESSGNPADGGLLVPYLDPGKLVIWLGEIKNRTSQGTLRRFLENGGRLFVASDRFPDETIPLATFVNISNSPLYGSGILGDSELDLSIWHGILDISAPAVPILLDKFGKTAGMWTDADSLHLVYLPLNLKQLAPEVLHQLFDSTLPLLFPDPASRGALEIPDHEVDGHQYQLVIHPGQPVSLRIRFEEHVEGAEILVRSLPDMEPITEIPMVETAPGQFEAAFHPPATGQYLLWPRLRSAGGRALLNGQSLQLTVLLFAPEHPILVFDRANASLSNQRALREDLEAILPRLGLQANLLQIFPEFEFLYPSFLDQYLDPGEVVIWLGSGLAEREQTAFRDFLARGGRLLMSSLDFPKSSDAHSFMQDLFHIDQVDPLERARFSATEGPTPQNYFMRYRPLTLSPPAIPLVADADGGIAGMRLDSDTYRAVYLSFEFRHMEANARRSLLQSELEFLGVPPLQEAKLQIEAILYPNPVMPLEPFAPRILVANLGLETTTPFKVGYQVQQNGLSLTTRVREEAPLTDGERREIQLPEWQPTAEARVQIHFGLSPSTADSLTYHSSRWLHLVDVPNPFDTVSLPADITAGNGAGFFDYDNDGDLDLYLVRLGLGNYLFRNDGDRFTEQARHAGVHDDGRGRGLALGDSDGDGDLDLYLVNEGANRFFRNEGDGRFSDRTENLFPSSKNSSSPHVGSGRSAGFFDYDNDGDLDLYLINARGTNGLFRNDRVLFTDQTAVAGLDDEDNGRSLGLADYDGDGDVDVFVGNQTGQSRLYQNDRGTFRDATWSLGLNLEGGEVAAVFGDYDNDGDLDLFTSRETGPNRLFRRDPGQLFRLVSSPDAGSLGARTVGAAFLDYDNDGDLDLSITALKPDAGGDQFFHNAGGGTLVPVGQLLGLRPESTGRALSFGDYDNDGDLDLFVADFRQSHFYRNTATPTHWLQVELSGSAANRYGLGASVELIVGEQQQFRELQSAFGYSSQIQPQIHFGLGTARYADTLRVTWPDGRQTVQSNLRANQHLRLLHPALATAVETGAENPPQSLRLLPGYPNPFNARIRIGYQLPAVGRTQLSIYDVLGRRVRILIDEEQDAGEYWTSWDGRDDAGRKGGSGIYFVKLSVHGMAQIQRVALLR